METPLIGLDGEETKGDLATSSETLRWNEAQEKSVRAALQYSSYVNLVHPLQNLKFRPKLNAIWDNLNAVRRLS